MIIDFANLGMPVFTGRDRGASARAKLKLSDVKATEVNEVRVPNEVYTITSSYFLGLFGPTVRQLGRDGFMEHFKFVAPAHIVSKLDDWIARALREQQDIIQ